jgi:hypothetical protein
MVSPRVYMEKLNMTKKINSRVPRKLVSHQKSFNCAAKGISLMVLIIVIAVICQSSIGSISASTPNFIEAEQQFNLDASYAYVGKGTPNVTVTDSRGNLLRPISQYPSAVYFNVTRPSVENLECDAILEVFNITIASDKGPAEHFIFFTGTNYNPSFSDAELDTLTWKIYDLFDIDTIDGVSGIFYPNWTAGDSFLSAKVGSYGTYTDYGNDLGLWSEGKPNAISVTFHRIGYVTMTNGAVSMQPDVISVNDKTQVQLQEHNEGFLKNEIVPLDELSENNRFQPNK